jgi:hypothetical protein
VIALADRARAASQWQEAASLYRRALDRNPHNPPIWVQYGHALKESGQVAEAEAAYRQALAQDPSVADSHLQLGHALKLQGKTKMARHAYLRAFVLDPQMSYLLDELRTLGWSERMVAELADAVTGSPAPAERPPTAADLPLGDEAVAAAVRRIITTVTGFCRIHGGIDYVVAGHHSAAGDAGRAALENVRAWYGTKRSSVLLLLTDQYLRPALPEFPPYVLVIDLAEALPESTIDQRMAILYLILRYVDPERFDIANSQVAQRLTERLPAGFFNSTSATRSVSGPQLAAAGPRNLAPSAARSLGPDVPWVTDTAPEEPPRLLKSHGEHNIIHYLGRFWAIPQRLGAIDWTDEAARSRPEVLGAEGEDHLISLLGARPTARQTRVEAADGGALARRPMPSRSDPWLVPAGARVIDALIPRSEIAEHRYAKVIGTRKLISVVITNSREESRLFDCLDALRGQEITLCGRDDVEIVVVDGSTRKETIQEHLPEDVHYLWQSDNHIRASRAKNVGAKLANGRYLAFVDSDALVGRHYFDSILRGFDRFGERVIQNGYVWGYHLEGSPDTRTEFGVWEQPDRLTSRFLPVTSANTAIAQSVFNETPGFDEDLINSGVADLLFGYHVGLLPGTAAVFNREMEVRHIPHPPVGADPNVDRSWAIVQRKWPEFYMHYVENGWR